jgi:uncharacterized protein YcaQ
MNWTKKQAREFLVNYHMINSPNLYTIKDVFNRIKSIQYDPLNVVGTNPELVLQSRVHNFKKEMLYDALYKERYLIDGWDKQMCIYQTNEFSYFDRVRKDISESSKISARKHLNLEFEDIIQEVFDRVKTNGPINSASIKLGETKKNIWGSTKASSVALSYLSHNGDIGIHSRKNSQKYYKIMHELLIDIPKSDPFKSEEEFIEYYLLRRIKSLGLMWNKSSVALSGRKIRTKSTREKYLKVLLKNDYIKKISIEGIKEPFYIPTESLNIPMQIEDKISFIAPLDNIIWDRELVNEIFNFRYTWEVYVPKLKRKYGYYVLPILKGSEMIGRIEFEKQRNSEPLIVSNLWLEENVKKTKKLEKELNRALQEFAKYLGTKEVQYNKDLEEGE